MADVLNEGLPRRSLLILKAGAAGAALLGTGGLAGCGSSSSPTVTNAASKPRQGGRLRAGLTGDSSTDTVDAQMQVNFLDHARLIQLYDSPTAFDLNAQVQLSLAEALVPNADASVWTMRVRPDVTFHNGKTLTADDIIYCFSPKG
jgi:peptide/nickel transport system substrate-binding protein